LGFGEYGEVLEISGEDKGDRFVNVISTLQTVNIYDLTVTYDKKSRKFILDIAGDQMEFNLTEFEHLILFLHSILEHFRRKRNEKPGKIGGV